MTTLEELSQGSPKVLIDTLAVVNQIHSLAASAGLTWHEYSPQAFLAALYQDDDAHDTCSLTACLNPLHPGPCKGWKGTLFDTAPGAWHSLEAAKVEKANATRIKKIQALKQAGKPIPHKLLTPIVAKPHPHAGQTANKASGDAHKAGLEVTENAGVKTNTPGKVSLGMAAKALGPVQLGPKGKKPTVASKGIAHVIAQEKVTPQYKLDKAAAITPEQWKALSEADQSTIRGELAKVKKDGFGPQQTKADELLAQLPAGAQPKTPTAVEKAQEANAAHQKAQAETVAKAAPLSGILAKAKAEAPLGGGPATSATQGNAMKNVGEAVYGQMSQPPSAWAAKIDGLKKKGNLEDQPGFKAYVNTVAQAALKQATVDNMPGLGHGSKDVGITEFNHEIVDHIKQGKPGLPPLMQKMVDHHKAVKDGKLPEAPKAPEVAPPAAPAVAAHHVPKTPGQQAATPKPDAAKVSDMQAKIAKAAERSEADQAKAKNRLGDTIPPTAPVAPVGIGVGAKPVKLPPLAKSKPLPKHVEDAIAMAKGQAPGASWSKNHLAAYQTLSAEEFHGLPPEVQSKIVAELVKGQSKFLDAKKVAAAKALLEKFGTGEGKKITAPKIEHVDFGTHLHDHNVTPAQAKAAVAQASIAEHFAVAKQLAGVTDAENPDSIDLAKKAIAGAAELDAHKTKMYTPAVLNQPQVKDATGAFHDATALEYHAENVHDAKSKAYNKISMELAHDHGELSPIEKASLEHYQKYLVSHPVKTDVDTMAKLAADQKAAGDNLDAALHDALKKANAPTPAAMSAAQIADRAKELLGEDATKPQISLTLADMQEAKKAGKVAAIVEADKYSPEVLNDPAVASKYDALESVHAQLAATKTTIAALDQHIKDAHGKALSTGVDIHGNPLTPDDKQIIALHTGDLLAINEHLNTSLKIGESKVSDATAQFEAAAAKAGGLLKPAEPVTLSGFDQATISAAYANAFAKHANKTVNYGLKTHDQTKAILNHPEYGNFKANLEDLKHLAGKIAVAHAEENTAEQGVAHDLDTGVAIPGPEQTAYLNKLMERKTLESQFNTLHKQAQTKLDAIRTSAGLKKRALPKVDTAAVKASAAETGYYKSAAFGAPNHGKAHTAKHYMLAKVGPKLGVAHQAPADKAMGKLGGGPSSTTKIKNAAPVTPAAPVKLGDADASIAHIPEAVKKAITNDFKNMPDGKYLADPAPDIFDNLVNLAAAHSTGDALSIDQVLKTIDETHSKSLGVANSGMMHKKVTDWLNTADGKLYAESHSTPDPKAVKQLKGEIDLPEGVTLAPGEKVQTLAGPGPHDTSLGEKAFKPLTALEAQQAQDAWMKANGVKWSATQKSSIKSYTGSTYSTYNGYLRGSGHGTQATKQAVINIQSAMMPLAQHTLLKRGTGWPPELASFQNNPKALMGKTFEDKAFVSTTVAGSSGHFSSQPLQLLIEAPEGTPAAFVNGISHFKGTENEMLLAAGTKFKVLSVDVDKFGHTRMRVRIVGDK